MSRAALERLTALARVGVAETSGSFTRDFRAVQIYSDAIASALGVERVEPRECLCCDDRPPLDATHPEECPE